MQGGSRTYGRAKIGLWFLKRSGGTTLAMLDNQLLSCPRDARAILSSDSSYNVLQKIGEISEFYAV